MGFRVKVCSQNKIAEETPGTWTDHKVIVSVTAAASIEIMLRCCPIGGNQINEG